jgi:hypothetical protein
VFGSVRRNNGVWRSQCTLVDVAANANIKRAFLKYGANFDASDGAHDVISLTR